MGTGHAEYLACEYLMQKFKEKGMLGDFTSIGAIKSAVETLAIEGCASFEHLHFSLHSALHSPPTRKDADSPSVIFSARRRKEAIAWLLPLE